MSEYIARVLHSVLMQIRLSFMPSEKRARQRSAREAKLAAQAKAAKRKKQIRNAIVIVIVAAVIVGIVFLSSGSSKKSSGSATTPNTQTPNQIAQKAANNLAVADGCPASTSTRVNTLHWPTAPTMTINTAKNYSATVKTTAGTFVIALNAKAAPIAVNNFVFLAKHNFYHCVIFHRVIPGFMDQTGDPTGTGSGGPGYQFTENGPPVANPQYPIGSVAMANSSPPGTTDPNTNGSQFFIVTGSQGESLPPDYVLFGKVTSGMSVADKINSEGTPQGVPPAVTQRMLSVTIKES